MVYTRIDKPITAPYNYYMKALKTIHLRVIDLEDRVIKLSQDKDYTPQKMRQLEDLLKLNKHLQSILTVPYEIELMQ